MPARADVALAGRLTYVVRPVNYTLSDPKFGTLRLTSGGRLSFILESGQTVFDAPVQEFHSLARSNTGAGFHLWHGATRHRFSADLSSFIGDPEDPLLRAREQAPLLGIAAVVAGPRQTIHARVCVEDWHQALGPRVGVAPPGLVVRPPFSPRMYWVVTLGSVFGIPAVIAGVTLLIKATAGS